MTGTVDWDVRLYEYRSLAKRFLAPFAYSPVETLVAEAGLDHFADPGNELGNLSDEGSLCTLDGKGEWIKVTEDASGRPLWYNTVTLRVVTDLEHLEYASEGGTVHEAVDPEFAVMNELHSSAVVLHVTEAWKGQIQKIRARHFFSEEVREKLDQVNMDMEGLVEVVQEEEKTAGQTDVDVIVSSCITKCDFSNINVDGFRTRITRTMAHGEFLYPDFHFPRFYSHSPLPMSHLAPISCDVTLCEDLFKLFGTKSIRLQLKANDTANAVIEDILSKSPDHVDLEKYVLKGLGLEDYMDGDEIMFFYEYVRQCLRRRVTVNLVLTEYPDEPLPSHDIQTNQDSYRVKADTDLPVLLADDFRGLSVENVPWDEIDVLPLTECKWPYRVKILGVDYSSNATAPLLSNSIGGLAIKTFIYHGTEIFAPSVLQTEYIALSEHPRWNAYLRPSKSVSFKYSILPRESRICFILTGASVEHKEEDVPLAWVSLPMIDQFGQLVRGTNSLKMWPITHETNVGGGFEFVFRGCTTDNMDTSLGIHPTMVTVEFDKFALPVVAPFVEPFREPNAKVVGTVKPLSKLSRKIRSRMDSLVQVDPLYSISEDDRTALWEARHHLVKFPEALPRFLQAVDWFSPEHRHEAHRMLNLWAPPKTPVSAIELLDVRYADYSVREYAVNCLRILQDDELHLFLLQLVQTLMFESYHDSPLSRFLIERALLSPFTVGHPLFWHLKAECVNPQFTERYALLLEEYLSFAGFHTKELRKQVEVMKVLTRISGQVLQLCREKDKTESEIMNIYRERLEELNERYLSDMGSFRIPLNPKWKVSTLVVSKCRYMSSKMVPLYLVFKNEDPDGEEIKVIFKSGDDLRQDILTLQLLQVMDKIWLSEGIDMRLTPYTCVAMGHNNSGKGVGMIEVVLNSDTTSTIQVKYGGGAMGALRMEPLAKYIEDFNRDASDYQQAVQNFINSCAGYCVATFVLGIGDRHNGNIMLTQDGHLFHIDFGHFLGNFKSKFGINRERAAFVLTPEMVPITFARPC